MLPQVLFLLLVVFRSIGAASGVCAKNVLFDTETTRQFNQDTEEYVSETKISFSIGLKETVCFQIEGENGQTDDSTIDGREYYFSFETVQSIFTYKNAYTFGLGEPKVKCLCDCPGVENHCSPSRENCQEDGNADSNCFDFYSDDHSTAGCGITSFLGSGEVCCSVSVQPANAVKYTAFEISTPVTRSLFRIEKDSPFESRQFASDLASGSPHFDGKLQFSFVNPGNINPIPDGWYFGRVGYKEAYTNVEVNGLSDWDINKLGWYKYQNNQYSISQTSVKNAFDSVVLNCDSSDMVVDFYSDANVTFAKPLEEFYAATVSNAERNDDERTLMLSYNDFSKINVIITIGGVKNVVQRYSMPSFLDFYGAALFDKHSNRFLNITIISGRGTLHGSMKVGSEIAANFDITMESGGGNYTNYVQITQWCNETMVADLCFHAGDNNLRCRIIKCHEEPLNDFILPNTAIDYEIILKANFFGLSTWSKYANPLEWFNGFDNWQEGVIMLISIFSYLIIIGLLIKIVRCFECGIKVCSCCTKLCCSCCKSKDRDIEADYHKPSKPRKHQHLSPRASGRSTRSNISNRQQKVTRNRRGVRGSLRYAGSSFKSMGSSFKSKSLQSRQLIRKQFSYSDSELANMYEHPEAYSFHNMAIEKFGREKYMILRQMVNTMSVEDIHNLRDDAPVRNNKDFLQQTDSRVCVEIDSDECLERLDMYRDPHKAKRQEQDRSIRSNRTNRSNQSARSHKPRRRDERGDETRRRDDRSPQSPSNKRPRKSKRREDRAFSPSSSNTRSRRKNKYSDDERSDVRSNRSQPRGSRDHYGRDLLSPDRRSPARKTRAGRRRRSRSRRTEDSYSDDSYSDSSSSSYTSYDNDKTDSTDESDTRPRHLDLPKDVYVVPEDTPLPQTPIISISSNQVVQFQDQAASQKS